jgi:hypothetical protein
MVREGAVIGGGPVGTTDLGGFVLTWSSDTRTLAARIRDLDGEVAAPGVIDLGPASGSPRAFLDAEDAPRVVAHRDDRFVVHPSICGEELR